MLKNIPDILSPELLKILMEMGHGDEIVIGDGNFPAAALANKLIRLDGHDVPVILEAVLKLFPLDTYVPAPVALMKVVEGDKTVPVIWDKFKEIINSTEPAEIEYIDRFEFYDRAKKAYAIIATSEKALYANLILKKGVVK